MSLREVKGPDLKTVTQDINLLKMRTIVQSCKRKHTDRCQSDIAGDTKNTQDLLDVH